MVSSRSAKFAGADEPERRSDLDFRTHMTRHGSPSREQRVRARDYSHSMVPGGLLVMSSVTRFTSRTSLVMRVEIFASTS